MEQLPEQSTRNKGDLVVSSKVLGHISEGLYRGPAGVFKELISNSYDANAKTVWISTGRPTFDVVTVSDDGDGIAPSKFEGLVSGGIGDSDKRIEPVPLVNDREVIGRLGIGLLGVSQISHEFSIVSHARSTETAFRASIWMKDFRRDILDNREVPDSEVGENDPTANRKYSVGGYEIEEIPFLPQKIGTTITATDPTEGFRRQLSESDPAPLPKDFREFSARSCVKDVLATGPLYDRTIWQVASLAPIPYLLGSTVAEGDKAMHGIATRLADFDFSVVVDGVKLFKPILVEGPTIEVPSNTVGNGNGPFHFPLELQKMVWGSNLKVRGYIYGSAGRALLPDDIRGVLIRLKHVGIGEYDKSFLGYRYAEGPRFAWLTGELFVERGLEDALTVGRDGFDAGHPHHIALREWLHKELRSRVFPTLYRGIDSRRKEREHERDTVRSDAFLELISDFAGVPIKIVEISDQNLPPIDIDLHDATATLNTAAAWPRGKRQRETAQRLSIIFELVRLIDSDRVPVDAFIALTRHLLSQR